MESTANQSSGLAQQPIAVLGGTGPQGRGLARRFAQAGLNVMIGSRTHERAAAAAAILARDTGVGISGADNPSAARQGEIVTVAVPWERHDELLRPLAAELAGKVVVDCVNP